MLRGCHPRRPARIERLPQRAGGAAGGLASAVANPTDLMKVRLQTDGMLKDAEGNLLPKKYTGMMNCLTTTISEEGFFALRTGVGPTVGRAVVLAAAELATYDEAKGFFKKFVPDGKREAAYIGENFQIGQSRVLLDPRTLAKLLDALDIHNDESVLDIGPGLGYSSAVISLMAEVVIAVEDDSSLASEAQEILSENGVDNVVVQFSKLEDGAPEPLTNPSCGHIISFISRAACVRHKLLLSSMSNKNSAATRLEPTSASTERRLQAELMYVAVASSALSRQKLEQSSGGNFERSMS